MNWRSRTAKFATVVVVALLVLNPETVQLALFIDALGLEMVLLLLEVQLIAIGSVFSAA